MNIPKAAITEIFSSIQGEGIFLGARQIFVRFKDCNLNCVYCDEMSRQLKSKEHSVPELMSKIRSLEESKGPHHSVALTGGEPLLYAEFLKEFLKLLKKENFKSYLETSGILSKELKHVIDLIDIVAMDFKLPSSTAQRPYWDEHLKFLKTAVKKRVFVKAVVTPDTKGEDIEKAVRLMKKVKEDIPFILQPATPVEKGDKEVNKRILLGFLEVATRNDFENIRVIPQIHKVLGVK